MFDTQLETGTKWLATAGLRPTRQRLALASLLVGDGQHRHVTAESLLLQEVTVDGSRSYFDTNTHDHPHFFWEDEARLTDAPSDQLVIAQLPDAPEGAEIASVDVVIRLRKKA